MILFAVVAAVACLGFVLSDVIRRPGDPYAAMRIPMLGAWGVTLLAYGVNPARFPHPGPETLLVLSIACLGSLAMIPFRGGREQAALARPAREDVAAWFRVALLVVAALLAIWDLYFIVERVYSYGWTAGLSQHRIDRGAKAGAYAIPGVEILHAVVAAAGAVAYGGWVKEGRRIGLATAGLGLATALFSSGRWDVVGYVVWLFAIHVFVSPPRGYRMVTRQFALYALLAVFFAAHGQLLGKLDGAAAQANSSTNQRAEIARRGAPMVVSGGLSSSAGDELSIPPPSEATTECPRWTDGVTEANLGLRELPRVTRVFVLYLAGPFATLDLALCEGRTAERTVLMYWPHKVLRILGLRQPESLLVVDPFLDIGIPFNNYTAIYPFLGEVGPWVGLVAWLLFGLGVHGFSRWSLSGPGVAGIVAGTAPFAMAIRTPWVNTFFDGTLVVYIGVALLPIVVSRILPDTRRDEAHLSGVAS